MSSALVLATAATLPSLPAHAADGDISYDINISQRPLPDALIDLAVQTNLSIGGIDPSRCGGTPVAIHARMKAERALRLLLAGSQCEVRRFNARTFRLEQKPQPRMGTAAAAPAPVQQSTTPALPPQEEVLIVRRPVALGSTPRAISVVPGTVLSGSDLDLTNLAVRVPGMAVTNLGPGRDKILLRGVSDSVLTGRTQSTVGLYLDDSALTYNAPDPDLLLVDMARVEVLKGPQGALYGQGSLSGVVRLVSNKPVVDAYESDVSAAAGSTQGGQTSWRGTAMLNLPLAHDTIGLRTVLYEDRFGGFIKDTLAGHKATNTTTRTGGRMSLLWPVTPHLTFTASAVAQRLNSENSQYVYANRPGYRRELNVAEPHNNAFENLSAGLQADIGRDQLKVSLSHLTHRLSTGYDAQPVARYVSVANSGVFFYEEDQTMSLTTAEISLLSPANARLRWLAGIFYANSEENFDPHLSDVYTLRHLYDEARIDRVSDIAAFGYLGYDPLPHWTVSLGLRSTHTSHDTDSLISNVHLLGYNPSGEVTGDINAGHLAHSAMLSYHPHDGFLVYAQVADGFRTGGFNTSTQQVSTVTPVYTGDQLTSSEVGMKFNTADNRLRLNLTAFQVDWRDIQSDQLRATGLPIVVNIGDGINTGAEVEADWMVTRVLQLHLAAQINNPRLNRPNPAFSKDQDTGMPYIARSSYSLTADWDQMVWGHALENSATLSYRSSSPLNYGPLRTVQMGAYTNLDLSSAATFGKIRIGTRITNATGVTSNSFAYGNPFSVDGANQITPLRPRTVWLSVSRRY